MKPTLSQLQRIGISCLMIRFRENGNHWLERGTITFNNNPHAEITTMFIRSMNGEKKYEIIFTLQNEQINDQFKYRFVYDGAERIFRIIDDEEIKVVNAD